MQEDTISKDKIIECLNSARSMELLSISQYMQEHYNFSHQGFNQLAKEIREIAIEEMKHAEYFAERLRELSAEPTSFMSPEIFKGEDPIKNYSYNLDLEATAIAKYNKFISICLEFSDHVSAKLFTDIIVVEQEHLERFKVIHNNIKNYGKDYLVQQQS